MITLIASTASDLMIEGSFSIHSTATVAETAAFLTGRGLGAAVVIDAAGHSIGVVTKTDIVNFQQQKADLPHGPGHHPTTVIDLMTPATFTIKHSATAKEAISQMILLNVHHLFVTDDSGVVIGMIEPLHVLKKLMD